MRIVEAIAEMLREEMDRGRGGDAVLPFPVRLEPRFTPFHHNHRPTGPRPPTESSVVLREDVIPLGDRRFLRVKVSTRDKYLPDLSEQLILAFKSRHPISFEVIGGERASFQFVVSEQDANHVTSQLRAHYPGAEIINDTDLIARRDGLNLFARSYRLRDSHLFQIKTNPQPEGLMPLAGILAGISNGETALLQVLFQQVQQPWHENILTVASDPWDSSKSSYVDLPELPRKAKSKIERPLIAANVRLAASTPELLQRLEGSFLSQFESGENGLVPLADSYPQEAVVGRFTQTPGMLLNVRELAALVHFPDPSMLAENVETARFSAPAPKLATQDILATFGWNAYRGAKTLVGISEEQITRHVAILGGTGTGKTNLMKTAFASLLDQGYGMAVLDPKGDLAQGFLDMVPEHRLKDVVWFDPTDREFPPALNVMNSSADLTNEDITAELMLGLKRLFRGSSEFGPRMEWILRTAVRTLLDSQGEKTLCDISRFLEDASYRTTVLASVNDRTLREFWQRRNLSRNVIDPVLNRLSSFVDRPSIRDVVCQPNLIDFRQIMRDKKIFIANLEKGRLQDAAFIIGSFILSRLQLAAMARPADERTLFPVLVDEFHVYAGQGMDTESIETFLSETRSYRAPLVVSTQYLGRLNRGVIAALFGNLGTQVCMHMGQIDAVLLQRELGKFSAEDLMNLGIGEAVIRMGSAKDTFNAEIPLAEVRVSNRAAIIERSRERYCRTRDEVEKLLNPDSDPDVWHATADEPGEAGGGEEHRQESISPNHEQEEKPIVPAAPVVAGPEKEGTQESRGNLTSVYKELVVYLEHIAEHPFLPALQRDTYLNLSRYKGSLIRRQLIDAGYVKPHKVGTGARSGQLVLQEITGTGYELLNSMKIRVRKPQGRGGFLHKYYCYKLKEFAEATWDGSVVQLEDGTMGKYADVTVRMPTGSEEDTGSVIAFEVFMTGEAKEIRGIAKGIEVFARVVVCAENRSALDSLKRKAVETLGEEILDKVSFHLVSQYLTTNTSQTDQKNAYGTSEAISERTEAKVAAPKIEHPPIREQNLLKSPTKSETEVEPTRASGKKRGRPPKTPLMELVQQAYTHIHDLDWLQECDLARSPEVLEKVQPEQMMPEAQALRGLLISAALQVVVDMGPVPGKEGMAAFLQGYLAGKSVADIAKELGVSREWCSRNYRREALRLARMQFVMGRSLA